MKISTLMGRLSKLKVQLAAAERRRLAGLRGIPQKYGFGSTEEFVTAVRQANGGGRGRPGRPAGTGAAAGSGERRRRAVITDETRAEVKRLVAAGKTGREISDSLQISLPSVQNIKKALGLVKKR